MTEIQRLTDKVKKFCDARDWEQFHSPKNLSMALSVEAGELVEIFQWLTENDSCNLTDKQMAHAKDELADVFYYLLRMADKLNIDLVESLEHKLVKNEAKYPVHLSHGSALKYDELPTGESKK